MADIDANRVELLRRTARELARALARQAELGPVGAPVCSEEAIRAAVAAMPEPSARDGAQDQATGPRSERPARRSSGDSDRESPTAAKRPWAVGDDASERGSSAVAASGGGQAAEAMRGESGAEESVQDGTPGGEAGLRAVRERLGDCTRCRLCEGRTQIVFGVGDPRARLMFIGEAPGYYEDREGEPFVGKAGKLLTRMIEAMGLRRDDVYIANVVKCRPPENRDPRPDEVARCEPFLLAQIEAVEPEVLVCLGRFAAQSLIGPDIRITRIRGQWHEFHGRPLMPMLHPAMLLRRPEHKRDAWGDLQQVMAKLGLPLPGES